jgi:hypothetical protein
MTFIEKNIVYRLCILILHGYKGLWFKCKVNFNLLTQQFNITVANFYFLFILQIIL